MNLHRGQKVDITKQRGFHIKVDKGLEIFLNYSPKLLYAELRP